MKRGELTYNNTYETATCFEFPWLATLSLRKGPPPWMRTHPLDLLLSKWAKNLIAGGGQRSLIIGYLKDQLQQTQKEPFGAVVVWIRIPSIGR